MKHETELLTLIGIYDEVARPYLDLFPPYTCIEQTRILVEVMRCFGVQADGLGVKLHVVIPAKEYQFTSGLDAEEWERAKKVAKSYHERPNNLGQICNGRHVVALVERSILVDSTLHQASSPEFGVVVEPGIFPIPFGKPLDDGDRIQAEANFVMDDNTNMKVTWITTPDREWAEDDGWEPSHLWPLIYLIADEMTEHMKEYVAKYGDTALRA